MTIRFADLRRAAAAAQAAAWIGLPFLRVGGESALRLDIPAGRLHAFGASYGVDELFVVLAAVLALTFGFLLLTLTLGRAWCGWACPQTVLSDLTAWAVPGRRTRGWRRAVGLAWTALLSALVAAVFLWYFVTPQQFAARLWAGQLGPVLGGSWAALGGVLFLDLAFLRQRFCTGVCPYAKLQGVLFDRATLVVAYDARRAADCVDCGACVRVCPTGIDIRHGLQAECIACAACIDACAPIMVKLRRPRQLVGYFAGAPGAPATSRPRRWLRPGVVALAVATALPLAALARVATHRTALGLEAVPVAAFTPRRGAGGAALDAFEVSLENRGRHPAVIRLSAQAGAAAVSLRPAELTLAPGERRSVPVLAQVSGLPPGRHPAVLRAEVAGREGLPGAPQVPLVLVVPEAP